MILVSLQKSKTLLLAYRFVSLILLALITSFIYTSVRSVVMFYRTSDMDPYFVLEDYSAMMVSHTLSALITVILILAFYRLNQFMRNVYLGFFTSRVNPKYLKQSAALLICHVLLNLLIFSISNLFFQYIFQDSTLLLMHTITFALFELVLAAILLSMAYVISRANELQEEQNLTI